MIQSSGKYYVYRYIRLDKNEPFYIGIGTKASKKIGFRSIKSEYHRAFSKHYSNIYNKIIKKTNYIVEILIESNDYNFIKNKEIEFVKLYGRIDNKTGILTNLTNGGEGTTGFITSLSTREKIGLNNASKGKFGKDNPRSKKIYQYDIDGNFIKEWDSLADVGRFFNMPNKRIPSFKNKTFKGYQWHYNFLGVQIKKVDYTVGLNNRLVKICVPIYKYDLNNNFLCKYNSYSDAYKDTGISINGIWGAIHRKNNICKGYIWTK